MDYTNHYNVARIQCHILFTCICLILYSIPNIIQIINCLSSFAVYCRFIIIYIRLICIYNHTSSDYYITCTFCVDLNSTSTFNLIPTDHFTSVVSLFSFFILLKNNYYYLLVFIIILNIIIYYL
jgi:hypothetical protein